MKIKHIASYQGHIWNRTSQSRQYSHMVVGVESIAAQRDEAEARARSNWKMNRHYHTKMAAGGTYVGHYANGQEYSTPITQEEQERAQAFLKKGAEGLVDEALASFDERVQSAWTTEDGRSAVYSAGWCSRLDLAQKLAARTPGGVVVEAEVIK